MNARSPLAFVIGALLLLVIGACSKRPDPDEDWNGPPPSPPVTLSRDRLEARAIADKVRQYNFLTDKDRMFLERHMYDEDGDASKALLAAKVLGLYEDNDYLSGTVANLITLNGAEAVKYLDGYFASLHAGVSSKPTKPDQVTKKILERKNLDSLNQEDKSQIESWLKSETLNHWYDLGLCSYAIELLVSQKSFSKDEKKWISDLLKVKREVADRELQQKLKAFKESHSTEKDPAKLRNYEDNLLRLQLSTKEPNEVWSFINDIVQGKTSR